MTKSSFWKRIQETLFPPVRCSDAPSMKEIEYLMAMTGFQTQKQLIDDALNFYSWAVEAISKDKLVGEKRLNGSFVQVLTEGLLKVRNDRQE